jgi:uncharacterized protein (TIGR02466 family)
MDEIFELFPTPVMRCGKLVPTELLKSLRLDLFGTATEQNSTTSELFHSKMIAEHKDPGASKYEHESVVRLVELVLPKISELGIHLLGEVLPWQVKDLWVNMMRAGGRQSIHNHANSFISGIVYLTASHPSASTVFTRALGGPTFVFSNRHATSTVGPFNADQWISPVPEAGDLLIFPSGLLHEVPTNRGEARATLAFNAIPSRLRAWDYSISLE